MLAEPLGVDVVDDRLLSVAIDSGADLDAANFFDRSARAEVLRSDEQHHVIHEAERVPKHELFHLTVVAAAPVRACQKCPADLDLAARLIVAEVSRRSDDLAVGSVVDDESPSTLHRFTEEVAKHFLLVAIACRVLLPDEWVLRDREQCFEIVGAQWSELDEFSPESGLQVNSLQFALGLERST